LPSRCAGSGSGRQGDRLTVDLYERELGKIDGAVAAIAESIVAGGLEAAEEQGLRSAFLHMVRLDDEGRLARRRTPWNELAERARPLLEHFVDEHLLVSHTVDGTRHVEVAHEALFRAWHRLALWLDEARGLLQFRQRLGRALAEWLRLKETPDELLRGPALAEAERWLEERPDDITAEEKRFIAASKALRQRELDALRRRRQRVMAGLAAGLVAALALSAFAAWQWRLAEQQRRLAVAGQLATEARGRSADSGEELVRGLLLATESLRSAWTPEGYAAWATAVRALGAGPLKRVALTAPVTGLAVHPQRPWVAVAEGEKVVRVFGLEPGRAGVEVTRLDVPGEFRGEPRARSLAVSPDGRWLAAARGPVINVWSTDGWRFVKSLEGHGQTRDLAFSADGELLVAAQTEVLFGPVETRTWSLPSEPLARYHGGRYALAVSFLDSSRFAVGGPASLALWSVAPGSSPPEASLRHDLSVEPRTIIHRLSLARDGRGLAWEDACCPRAFTLPAAPDATSITVESLQGCEGAPRVANATGGHWLGSAGELSLACPDPEGHLWLSHPLGSVATWLAAPDATTTAFSADGRWLIAGGKRLELWDLARLGIRQVPRALAIPARAVAWSPDGRWLAAGGFDALARVYDAKTFDEVYKSEEEGDARGVDLAFSSSGRLVARSGHSVSIFEAGGGWIRLARVEAGWQPSLALSPDGAWVMTLTPANTVARSGQLIRPSRSRVWSLKDDAEVAWRTHQEADIETYLAENPHFTRERLVIHWEGEAKSDRSEENLPLGEGGRLELLQQASGWERVEFDARRSSPDGRWAFEQGALLDPVTERSVVTLGAKGLEKHAWSPDLGRGSEWLALTQDDGVRIWPLGPVAALVEAACARLPRNLTPEEWPLGGTPPVTCRGVEPNPLPR
jgi:WD40 repeat protein